MSLSRFNFGGITNGDITTRGFTNRTCNTHSSIIAYIVPIIQADFEILSTILVW